MQWLGCGLCTAWTMAYKQALYMCLSSKIKALKIKTVFIGVRHCDSLHTLSHFHKMRQVLLTSLQMSTRGLERFARVHRDSSCHKSISQGWQKALLPKITATELYQRWLFSLLQNETWLFSWVIYWFLIIKIQTDEIIFISPLCCLASSSIKRGHWVKPLVVSPGCTWEPPEEFSHLDPPHANWIRISAVAPKHWNLFLSSPADCKEPSDFWLCKSSLCDYISTFL